MKLWFEINGKPLGTFVRDRAADIIDARVESDDAKNYYILLRLKHELAPDKLKMLEFDFEEIFPVVDYATENFAPDPFWDAPFTDNKDK